MPSAQTARGSGSFCADFSMCSAQLDVAQQLVALARDLVLEQRAAARAVELPEHGPLVDVALPVADVGVRRGDLGIVAHAALLVVPGRRSEVGSALRAAELAAAKIKAVGEIERYFCLYFL